MSVEKRFLNFDDLKSQVRVTGLTLSERSSGSRQLISRRQTMPVMVDRKTSRRGSKPCSSTEAKLNGHSDSKQCERMAEDSDSMRYVRISPPPLDKVSKPQKILFERRDVCGANENVQGEKIPRFLTRRDVVVSTKTPVRQNQKHLNSYKLDISVEVKPKYYQKWARNTKKKHYNTDTYSFPSMSNLQKQNKVQRKRKERRNSIKCSGPRNRRLPRTHSSGSLCSNENSCSNVAEWPPIPRIEISDFTDDEIETGTAQENPVFDTVEDGNVGQDEANTMDIHLTESALDSENIDGRDYGFKNSSLAPSSDTQSEAVDHNQKIDPTKCSYCPKFLTVEMDETLTKKYPFPKCDANGGYTMIRVASEESTTHDNNANKVKQVNRNFGQEVTLSRQLISTEVLNDVVGRLPALENRLESPFRYGKESRPDQNKPRHYSYYPARPIYNDLKKKRDKLSQLVSTPSTLDYRRCKTDVGLCMSSLPESRIPMKIATSSPRFSIPDNLIVDFETLRIASHMDKLRKTLSQLPQGPRDFWVNKNVSGSAVPSVSSVRNRGFKTVIFGSSVIE